MGAFTGVFTGAFTGVFTGVFRKNKQPAIILGMVCCLFISVSQLQVAVAGADIPAVIRVKPSASVLGPDILLGEIADIQAVDFLRHELSGISLGPSPNPGRTRMLEKDRILSILGSDRLVHKDIRIDVPARVYVKRQSQTLEKKQLQKVFERFLKEHFPGKDYKLKSFSVKGLEPYPAGPVSFAFDPDSHPGTEGRVTVALDLFVGEEKVDRLILKGRVAVYEKVACARRSLKRGEKISPEDVCFISKNVFDLRGEVARTLPELENKIVRSGIRKGDSFNLSLLKESPLMKRGEVVKLVARKKHLTIETLGILAEDGYVNQVVRVENLSSGQPIRGRVTSDAVVEVLF